MIINYPDTIEDDKSIFDVEEEGRCNLVLVAARYTGSRSSVPANKYRTQAGWPGNSPFQGGPPDPDGSGRLPGPAQGALLADWITPDAGENRTVAALEADEDVEVIYNRAEIARCMLESNYLDPSVFGMGFDEELRDRVFDALGLVEAGVRDMTEYRSQLREIAGIQVDEEARLREARDSRRVKEYRSEYPRGELITAATILGMEDAGDSGRIELSTWLADQDREAVRYALEGKVEAARAAQAGEDAELEEPFTAADAEGVYDHDELKDAVKAAREGTGEFSLRGATNENMAEFLVETKGLTEAEIDALLMR